MTTLYQNKTITIIGLGKTGLSCVEYLQSQQANIRVIDTRQHPAGAEQLPKNVPLHTGSLINNGYLRAILLSLAQDSR